MPAELNNITEKTPKAVQIWGFYNPVNATEVAAAVKTIAAGLKGDKNVVHLMSGTHGACDKKGAVRPDFLEPKFLKEDKATAKLLAGIKTKDGKAITIEVHDFNTKQEATAPDPVTASMAKLNKDLRELTKGEGTHTFVLAYCCSAGAKK
jgi:hypothetical protein